MARIKTSFFCTECGHEASGWLGRCPGCGAWNTLVEEKKTAKNIAGGGSWVSAQTKDPVPARLADVTATTAGRLSSGIGEFDRVLGGGFVRGSLVLIGGDPGIGKSTLLLQVFGHMSTSKKILYVTGEESPQQVKIRADRLGLGDSRRGHLLAAPGFSVIEQVLLRTNPTWPLSIPFRRCLSKSSTPPRAASVRSGRPLPVFCVWRKSRTSSSFWSVMSPRTVPLPAPECWSTWLIPFFISKARNICSCACCAP